MLKNNEHAEKLDNPFQWSGGAPLPFVVASDYKIALVYYMQDSIYIPNGKNINITADMPDNIALVEFEHGYAHKLEGINDEVFGWHRLLKHGGYDLYVVENSKWIEEMQSINSHHPYYDSEHWKKRKHFLFAFHDSIFHCIANSYKITKYQKSYNEMIQIALTKVMESK